MSIQPIDRPLFIALLALAASGFVIAAAIFLDQPLNPNEWWLTIWAGVTAVFTVVLAVSTIALWLETKAVGKRSEGVIRTAERAYVKMSHCPPGLRTTDTLRTYLITLEVTNFGRTPATVTDALIKCLTLPVGQKLPAEPDYAKDPGPHDPPKAFLVTNDTFSFVRRWKVQANIELPQPEAELYAIGFVDYMDAFGKRYRSGYARRYKPERNLQDPDVYLTDESYRGRSNLIFVSQEGYNYDRLFQEVVSGP